MKEVFKVTGSIIGVIVGILAITWIITSNEFFLYKFFAPKQEAVRRHVFEQTKSYNQGMIQELQNMQMEYIKTDKDGKAAMSSIILHRAADYDENRLPTDLRVFISQLKRERGM
jgi:hypothetical protein